MTLTIAHLYQESDIRFHEPHAAQLHIYHTIQGLQQAGHEVTLLALQGRDVLCTKDLQIFRSDKRLSSHYGRLGWSGHTLFKWFESGVRRLQSELHLPYFALFDSYRVLDACIQNLQGFDLIHERFNLLSLGAALASRKLDIPFVLEVNADLLEQRKFKGIPEKGLRGLFAVWATRFCFKAATKIICISSDLKDHLHRKWNIAEDKLTVLPIAADVEAFKPGDKAKEVRRGLGLKDEPVVMWVGGFYPWHDLELLLESFGNVLRKQPRARLVLVGEGQTRPAVAQNIVRSGLQHAVIMTGAIPHTRVPDMVSIADVAVVPAEPVPASRGGTGTPLKLFEYMAAGKAIVATDVNQASEVIQHGYNGLLVASGDIDGFAQAILALLDDSEKRSCYGQNARQDALEKYSWQQYTRRLNEIYMSVIQ